MSLPRCLAPIAVGLAAACQTLSEEVPPLGDKLPFHVAVVPLETAQRFELPDHEDITEMRFEPDLARLSEELTTALENVFERVTLLEPDAQPSPERERALVKAAVDGGADLILRSELWYHPGIWRQRRGSIYWPDPLLSWMFRDYIYRVEVELSAEIHDPHTIRFARDVELGDDAARLLFTSAGFRGSPRTNRELGPAVVFIGEDEEREQFIRHRVELALAARLVTNIAGKRANLERFAPDIAPFRIDAGDFTARLAGSQRVRVSGRIRLEADAYAERMSGWALSSGTSRLSGSFLSTVPAHDPERGELVYAFDERLDVQEPPAHVRLTLIAGDAEPYVRSYTLPVSGLPAGTDDVVAYQPK